jgi:hypothetical protein
MITGSLRLGLSRKEIYRAGKEWKGRSDIQEGDWSSILV